MLIKEMKMKMMEDLHGLYPGQEVPQMVGLLMEWATGLDRVSLAVEREKLLTGSETESLGRALEELKRFKPVQYITGKTWFHGLDFEVARGVLIPRPETEELVHWILQDYKDRDGARVLDLGSGSGCIAVALGKFLHQSSVSATDITLESMELTRRNALRHQVDVGFILSDMLMEQCHEDLGSYDIIVSNPPYVRRNEMAAMLPNVLEYEPHQALFVPDDDPLLFFRAIALIGKKHLLPGGRIYVEINEDLGPETCACFLENGYSGVELRKDLHGRDRMIRIHPG